jgi:hypothetical protein
MKGHKVWINPKGGSHYHLRKCVMIDSTDYIEIFYSKVDKNKYRPCGCIDNQERRVSLNGI